MIPGTTSAKSRSPRSNVGTGRNPCRSISASAPVLSFCDVACTVQPAQRPALHSQPVSALPIPRRCHGSATRIPISAVRGSSETRFSSPTGIPREVASNATPSGGPASR